MATLKNVQRKINQSPEIAFKPVWEQMPLPVLITALDGTIRYANSSFCALGGYLAGELIGQVFPQAFLVDPPMKQSAPAFSAQPELRNEWQLRKQNGESWWARVLVTELGERESAELRLVTLQDITDSKRLEEALRFSEEKFTKLFDAIPIPLAISTMPDRKFIEVNRSFLEIGELKREDIIGRQSTELKWKDSAEADRVNKELQGQEHSRGIEMSLLSTSGELHTSLLKAEVVELGGLDYLVSASVDITERKRAEKALQESEARFRMLSENSLSGIFILRNGYFSYVNPAFSAMLGRPRNEIIGCDPCSLVHPEDWPNVNEAFASRLMGKQTTLQYDFRCFRGDGKIVWLEALSALFEDEGQPALLGTVLDITEQRKVKEEADRLRQVMAHVSRVNTLGELAASLAHELNQPLTAIMANAQTALHMIHSGQVKTSEIQEILEDITSDDRRAGDIIRRMREPLKRGQLTLELLDVNNLIKEIYQLVRNDAVIASVTIELTLVRGLPLIKGDKTQLQQVLLNLMVNALDAVKEQKIGQRRIEVSSTADGDRFIRVEVRDSGPGIPEHNRQHLFELLCTTKPDGLGVGLSISKHLVQAHGGRIWQENLPAGGASFIFTLPLER